MDSTKIVRENWKPISQGLITIILLVLIISLFGLNWWQIILTIVGFQIAMQLYGVFKKGKKFSFKQLILGAAKVSGLVILITLLAQWAWIGLLGTLVAFVIYRVVTNFSTYKWGIDQVSQAMFGYSMFQAYNIDKKKVFTAITILAVLIFVIALTITHFNIYTIALLLLSGWTFYYYFFKRKGDKK